jgi:hypothetical protein
MGIEIVGSVSGARQDVDPTSKAGKVSNRPPEGEGFYFHSSRSGLLAGAAAASVVWALRWTHATKLLVVDVIRIRALITTPFTAAQAWGFEGVIGRTYTASHTGGTQFLPSADTTNAWKKRTAWPISNVAEIRMATTAALGGGTVTADTSHFVNDFAWELAAAATVSRSVVYCEKDYGDGSAAPIILAQNEGLLVRPTDTLGAAGVVRLSVEVAWHEVTDATKL